MSCTRVDRAPSARIRGAFLALPLYAVLAASCDDGVIFDTEGMGGESGEDGGDGGGDGGSGGGGIPEGATAGELTLLAPSLDEFILRGTLPVPEGTYPRADGRNPLSILDFDGTVVPTQIEIVSKYPDFAVDGADVVEVIGRVRRAPGVAAGTEVHYAVALDSHPERTDPGTPDVADLKNGPLIVPTAVKSLLDDAEGIEIRAEDCFGNEYVCTPLDGSGSLRIERYGEAQAELRTYQVLLPNPAKSGSTGTLSHLLGVHAYVSTYAEEELVGLDLRFNNAPSGNDPTTSADDVLDKVYFDTIEIRVPSTWYVQQDYPDPFFGTATTSNGTRIAPLVEPIGDGTLHVIRWQGHFNRRLMLSTSAWQSRARAYLDREDMGFATRGNDPGDGHEYWSWWNAATARYFPQAHLLPSLEHVGKSALRASFDDDEAKLRLHLLNGTGDGVYPVESGVLGWGHPYGVSYGGMTGGAEIIIFDGVRLAESAYRVGYRQYEAQHRMHSCRQPNVLYDADGEPSAIEDWVVNAGSGNAYVPFEHYVTPTLKPNDPFGFDQAPTFQIDFVAANAKIPAYEGAHFGYAPHDYQHMIRYTRSAKVLAWLGNDPLAKDDLRALAEVWRFTYHPYFNSSSGGVQGSGMRGARGFVDANPGKGFPFGRGEAWATDCNVAAYALSDEAWRSAKRPWFDLIADLVADGQGACNGFIQAQINEKWVGGLFRARQAIESSITENMLRGMVERVYRGTDNGYTALVDDVLEASLQASISEMAWFPGEIAPYIYTGVGPTDVSLPVFCTRFEMPANAITDADENYQNWSSLAYGWEATGDDEFLDKALLEIGGGIDLLTELEADGVSNIDNRAALLALMQELNGDF